MGVKERTSEKLFQLYQEKGSKFAIEVARGVLGTAKPVKDERAQHLNGQLCETVLEIKLHEYVKQKDLDWIVSKSLVLSDPENRDSDFRTEIDLLLCTRKCMYLFECKSYGGTKCLSGNGVLQSKSSNGVKHKFDVYKQSSLHLEVAHKIFDRFSRTPEYQMLMFNFSLGSLEDKRSMRERAEMPCLETDTVIPYLERREAATTENWDLEYIRKALNVLEKDSGRKHLEHLKYVQSLHGTEERE